MQRRSFLAGGIVSAAGAFGRHARAQDRGRELRFVPQGNLQGLDPVCTPTTVARTHGYMVWDTLYGQDMRGRASPQMVAGHEVSTDRLVWRFTLRENLLFHDGEKVRAQDCVPSILRWAKRRGYGEALLARLGEIRALDDRRFEIRLKRPFPLMLEALGTDACFIMPERLARTDPFSQIPEVIGSGPYRFVPEEWVPGGKAVYARWDRYVPVVTAPNFTSGAKVAQFDRVVWLMMPDPAIASAALVQGEVDWWESPMVDLLPVLRGAEGVRLQVDDTIGVQAMLAFNHLHPPFDNPKLLQALLPALDQAEFMQAALGSEPDLFNIPCGVFTPGQPMANEAGLEELTGPRDLGLARRLVAESGYRGEPVVLLAPTDYPATQALCQTAAALFRRLGLTVQQVDMDWAALVARRTSREPPSHGGWSAFCTTHDGVSVATPANHAPLRGTGRHGWFGWPTSPRIEALRDAWFDAPHQMARLEICERIQMQVWEEVPYLPLGQWFKPTALRSDLVDVVEAPFPLFWGVRRE
ncbi:ABC transporter substrate-binding protein [Rhodovastum atsumiense]|uniref:ABC transporter substrate-binding protein n=1 Tax=Rhodovastum atsumiense TaxID=504468 RepID=A0A5M6IUQ4_9PROT|nr:ABC transporter substrate-binding protein [Rhodovastum atsumiense]KAA5612034.1 ABC transporter substrate-binding protein [Rhodovastum atsumiense]CAH2604102.1 ABC transporter substrate-binding protein [Rhodovastum atsumiense]